MAITKYAFRRPAYPAWRDFDDVSNRLARFFEDPTFLAGERAGHWMPPVSVSETADELVLTAELPGLTEEDVSIELENNPEQQKQDYDNEDRSLDEGMFDGADAGLDEVGSVVVSVDPDTVGERLLDFGYFLFDSVDDDLGVFALEHDRHAENGFAPAVFAGGAEPYLRGDLHVGEVLDIKGRSILGFEHDEFYVFNSAQ